MLGFTKRLENQLQKEGNDKKDHQLFNIGENTNKLSEILKQNIKNQEKEKEKVENDVYIQQLTEKWAEYDHQIGKLEQNIKSIKDQQFCILQNVNEEKNRLKLEKQIEKKMEFKKIQFFDKIQENIENHKKRSIQNLQRFQFSQDISQIEENSKKEIQTAKQYVQFEIENAEQVNFDLKRQIEYFKLQKMELEIQVEQLQKKIIAKSQKIEELEQENIQIRQDNIKIADFKDLYLSLEKKFPKTDLTKLVQNYNHMEKETIKNIEENADKYEENQELQQKIGKLQNKIQVQTQQNKESIKKYQQQINLLESQNNIEKQIDLENNQYKSMYFTLFNKIMHVFSDWRDHLSVFEYNQFTEADSWIIGEWEQNLEGTNQFNTQLEISKMDATTKKKLLNSQLQSNKTQKESKKKNLQYTQQQLQERQSKADPIQLLTMIQKYVTFNSDEKQQEFIRKLIAEINLIARKSNIESSPHQYEPYQTLESIQKYIQHLENKIKGLLQKNQDYNNINSNLKTRQTIKKVQSSNNLGNSKTPKSNQIIKITQFKDEK